MVEVFRKWTSPFLPIRKYTIKGCEIAALYSLVVLETIAIGETTGGHGVR